jgi:hypothetical protein
MHVRFVAMALAALSGLAAPPARAQTPAAAPRLALSFAADGTVTLSAQNVSIREILAEWQRQCGCYVVNADRMAGAPVTVPLLFEHMPQARVLESLLRPAAGYVLTPRRAGSASPSNYEVIYILATSGVAPPPAPLASASPFSSRPAAVPIATAGSPDDEIPPVTPVRPDNRAPAPPPAPAPAARPNSPGVSIIPIVPIGGAPTNAPAPGTSTPPPARPPGN